MKRAIYMIFSISFVWIFSACAIEQPITKPTVQKGSVVARAEWPENLPPELATVRMIISSPDMEPMVKKFKFSDKAGAIHAMSGVPAGDNRKVILEGLNSNSDRLYTGSATNITVIPRDIVDSGLIVMNPKAKKIVGPKAPTNVRAKAGDGNVTIRWIRVSGADSYSIYMNIKTGASKRNFDARKTTTSSSYKWEGLRNGTTYYFIVTAENQHGDSKESIEVGSTPALPKVVKKAPKKVIEQPKVEKPKAPNRVKNVRTKSGDEKATITWDSVSGAASYGIYMSRSKGASKRNFDARKTASSNSYTWAELKNGETYYFIVTAENQHGDSKESIEVDSTPVPPKAVKKAPETVIEQPRVEKPKAPNRVRNVRAIAGDEKATITWDSVSGADSYGIYMNKKTGVSRKNFYAMKTTKSNSYKWEGLSNGTTYYFIVVSANSAGVSKESKEIYSNPKPIKVVEKTPKEIAKPSKETQKTSVASIKTTKEVSEGFKVTTLSPDEMLREVDNIRAPGKNFVFDMKLTFKKGNKETVNKTTTRVKDAVKSLVIYKYPPSQKGRVMLMVESNMWIYFPGTKRAIRISPTQQLLGQVSNADVDRVVYSIDYKAETVVKDIIGNENYLKMLLRAKSKGAAYGSIKLWIKKDTFRLFKAEFNTLSGRVLKTVFYKGYQNVLGKNRPMVHEVHDALKKSEITIMEYSNMRVEETPDNYFQKTYMQRVPQR